MAGPRILHVLSQRPSWTGSGMALNAIVTAAQKAGYVQQAIVGVPSEDANPNIADLPSDCVHPLAFESEQLPFALPGMSDVMPYNSSVFSTLTQDQLEVYVEAWKKHVAPIIADFQPDLIHSHHIWILSSLLKDVAPQTPVVTHCHATGLRQMSLCPHLANEVAKGCARNDAFVVLHRDHATDLSDKLGVAADRVTIVGSGYRDDVFHSKLRTEDAIQIAFAGKLSRAKGLPQLLDVMESLAAAKPEVTLKIAGTGTGSEADEIRERVADMGNVELLGQINQTELATLLRASKLFVLPSFYEGLPLVLVEAAACGCQLVATDLPGVVDQLAPALGDQLELVTMPPMQSVDQPETDALSDFVDRLRLGVMAALEKPNVSGSTPGLRSMTWQGVFERIEAVWESATQP